MRIEITQELDADCDALEVPWTSPADPSLRYWDLKLHPEKAAGLPECRLFPVLADCLAKVNAHSSPLRSAKCDVWCSTDLAEDERLDFNLPFKTGSYLDLVLEDVEMRKSIEAHTGLAEQLRRRLSALRVRPDRAAGQGGRSDEDGAIRRPARVHGRKDNTPDEQHLHHQAEVGKEGRRPPSETPVLRRDDCVHGIRESFAGITAPPDV